MWRYYCYAVSITVTASLVTVTIFAVVARILGWTVALVREMCWVCPIGNTRAPVLARIACTRTYRPCISHKHTQTVDSVSCSTYE